MSKSQHNHESMQNTQNQNNEMSEDPKDGSRNSDVLDQASAPSPAEKKPLHDRQEDSAIEAFGQEGAGIAAKE